MAPFYTFFFFFFLLLTIFQLLSANPSPNFPCNPPHHNLYPFCNTSLSTTSRAQSLISLLTLSEKIHQLSNNASAVPRLGIPAYQWWSEALHGVATNGPGVSFNGAGGVSAATGFPQVILAAAAFNRTLWRSIAAAVAVEARAMYNVGQAGLTFWAPSINIFRDPRWGRGQETPGEDPLVASAYAVEFVRGFQGEAEPPIWRNGLGEKRVLKGVGGFGSDLMVSACCKHFTAYDLEKWGNFTRYTFDAVVSEQDLEDTYQPPFKSCIQQGEASCLMCSYNRLNGIPACARRDILEKARNVWGFNGYVTSDCDAVATVYEYQKYVTNPEDAVSDVLKAGMDINCGTFLLRHTQSAIDQGKLLEEDLDRALLNLFSVQLRLGLFDGNPEEGQFGKLGASDVCTLEHRELALEGAKQGIVLLKNDQGFLPLDKNYVSSLAIIGPAAADAGKLGGGYAGVPCMRTSLFEALKEYVEGVYYSSGCLDVPCISDAGFSDAIHIAEKAEFVIVVVGLDLSQETEDRDRISLLLPGRQMGLVSSVASTTKKPLILVLTGGGPIDVSFAKNDPRIASILWVGYPGEAGGKALAEVIFGYSNPGGKLPVTWYPESFTDVPMNDMSMRADPSHSYPGRTYRFYTGSRVYDFGHGLSYSNFVYTRLSVPKKITLLQLMKADSIEKIRQRSDRLDYIFLDELKSCHSLRFYADISVTNVGAMDGSHVVLLFSTFPKAHHGAPQKQLIGFSRVNTKAYRSTDTSIPVDPCEHLTMADEAGNRILPLGDYMLMLEGVQHSISIEI